jgi:hypothetical protein
MAIGVKRTFSEAIVLALPDEYQNKDKCSDHGDINSEDKYYATGM